MVAAVAAAVSVVVLKLVGLANVAVPFAAVIGVAAAFVAAGDAPAEAEVATRGDAA